MKDDLSYTIEIYKKSKEDISVIISEYRSHGDTLILVNKLRDKTSTFFNCLAYFQGRLFAFGDYKKAKAIMEITKIHDDMIFEEIWTRLFEAFNTLFDKYPNWDDASFTVIGEIVLKYWDSFGIYPKSETDKDDVFLSIPIF